MEKQQLDAYHLAAEAQRKRFSFRRPDTLPNDKKTNFRMASAPHEKVVMLVLNEGGDNNLHFHTDMDSVYYVLKGRVRFWAVGDEIVGDLGPHDGILMPAGARYRFEKIGDEEAHMFSVAVYPRGSESAKRVDASPPKPPGNLHIVDNTDGKNPPAPERSLRARRDADGRASD